MAVVDKVLGPASGLPAVERSTDPYVLSGVAASPGIVPGTARVVCTREEASKLAGATSWCAR